MPVSFEQLAAFLESLGNLPPDKLSGVRFAPRGKVQAVCHITPWPKDADWNSARARATQLQARLQDISTRGLRILCQQLMNPGDQFVLHLPHDHLGTYHLLYTARHCRRARPKFYSVGAELLCSLTDSLPTPPDPAKIIQIQQSILS